MPDATLLITGDLTALVPSAGSRVCIVPRDSIAASADSHRGLRLRRTLRFFGHSDGNGYPGHVYTAFPMQTSPGVFSETALQRYDFVLAQCAQVRHMGTSRRPGL